MELVSTYSVFVRDTSATACGVQETKKVGLPTFLSLARPQTVVKGV
jgi:hypothetical protein